MKMIVVAAAVLAGPFAFGETLTWTGDAGTNWTATDENWKTAGGDPSAWVSGSDALFTATGAGALAVDGGLTASTLTFDGTGVNYTFNPAGTGSMILPGKLVTVTNGAYFTLNRALTDPSAVTVRVSRASTFCLNDRWLMSGTWASFVCDGGTLLFNHQGVYVEFLTLSNGALVNDPNGGTGPSYRMGWNQDVACVYSRGSNSATNEIRANISQYGQGNQKLVFDVEQPLLLTGRLFGPLDGDPGHRPRFTEKRGPGTMIMRCNSIAYSTKVGSGDRAGTLLAPTSTFSVVEGTLRVEAGNCFKSYVQPVTVKDGATLDLVSGGQGITTLTIEKGGLLKLTGNNVIGSWTAVVLDGGKMHCYNQLQHIRDLTLRNGGEIEKGEDIRFGYERTFPVLASEGTGTNEINTIVRFYNSGVTDFKDDKGTVTNRVPTVDTELQAITFKTDAPLRFSATPKHSTDGAAHCPLHYRKTGASELIFNYNVTDAARTQVVTGRLDVIEGALRLAKTNAMNADHADQTLIFSNATTFAVSAGTTNSVKMAEFHGEVTLDIGKDAALSFVDYDFDEMTQLNVTPTLGATSLRFGTSQCLTVEELGRFKARGYTFEQDADGYVHAVKNGIILLVR